MQNKRIIIDSTPIANESIPDSLLMKIISIMAKMMNPIQTYGTKFCTKFFWSIR